MTLGKTEQDIERDAVMAVVRAELTAFWNGDLAAWSSCFAQIPETWFLGYWRHGGLALRSGFEDIQQRARDTMAVMKGTASEFAEKVVRENVTVRVGGTTAWVSFRQRYDMEGSPFATKRGPGGFTQELRILEKLEGRWKYVVLVALDPGLDNAGGALLRLDNDGRIIWRSEGSDAALQADDDLSVRNGRLRIRNRAADRKLQLAIKWAASQDLRLMASRGSVPIVMDGGEGAPTKLWWLTANSGMILFAFERTQLTEERLRLAAAVYDLSPGQQKLAQEVISGRSLVEIARRTSRSENTLRTQLRRMFDKVGVHTQPALVRVLLSVATPR